MNGIYLRRLGKFLLQPGDGGASAVQLAMAQRELERLGFVLSAAAYQRLQTQSAEQLARCLRELCRHLARTTGAHREHRPLFPDFPLGSMRAGAAELYARALDHYRTLLHDRRNATEPAMPLRRGKALREIELGDLDEFERILTGLTASPTSLSQQDREDLQWFLAQYRHRALALLPATIPFKETLALVGAGLLRHARDPATERFVSERLATATDVLRLAAAWSEGDVSLAAPTRFRPMPRWLRRLLLESLHRIGDPGEDMARWKERWKRLGERLHPGDYRERMPDVWAAFDGLRRGRAPSGFNAVVERELLAGRIDRAASHLSGRPGELARRLDHLLRLGADADATLQRFRDVAAQVSTPVLLQLLSHFRHRGQSALRVFFPKGDLARAWATFDRREPLPPAVIEAAVAICRQALIARFAARAPLGACYIDPALATLRTPLAQRSASRALRTLTRGSRLAFADTRYIRLFLWWTNGNSRTDIDLSATLFDGEYRFLDAIAYYNLRNYGGHHSGDIVDAPRGAAEFIDLDLERLRQLSVRFVVVSVHSFTEQPYCDLPECFAGWMSRSDLDSGEPFEARTVEDRIDLASRQNSCLPFILDLEQRAVLWTDAGIGGAPRWNNAANQLSGVSLLLRAMVDCATPDLATLFELHAHARGRLVDDRALADTVFAPDGGVSPFEPDRIRAEYL